MKIFAIMGLASLVGISALGALTALSGLLPAKRGPAAGPAPAQPAFALAVGTAVDAAVETTDAVDSESDDCDDPVRA
jgi:hypothetical protein